MVAEEKDGADSLANRHEMSSVRGMAAQRGNAASAIKTDVANFINTMLFVFALLTNPHLLNQSK
jgi:hypothetical protein